MIYDDNDYVLFILFILFIVNLYYNTMQAYRQYNCNNGYQYSDNNIL